LLLLIPVPDRAEHLRRWQGIAHPPQRHRKWPRQLRGETGCCIVWGEAWCGRAEAALDAAQRRLG
jgi:hypothetical protein